MSKLEKEAIRQYALWLKHLKEQRENRGIKTQKDLATKMGISTGYLNKLENALSIPSTMVNLFKYLLVNSFDLSPMYKVRIHPEPGSIEEEKKELIRKIKEDFDEDMIGYLVEISEIGQLFRLKVKKD